MNRRCFIQMSCHILVCLFLTISTASARVCFLPDSADCGGADVSIPDVPCRYYSCREAGLKMKLIKLAMMKELITMAV